MINLSVTESSELKLIQHIASQCPTRSLADILTADSNYLVSPSIFMAHLLGVCVKERTVMLVRHQHCYCYSLVLWPGAVGHKNTLSE